MAAMTSVEDKLRKVHDGLLMELSAKNAIIADYDDQLKTVKEKLTQIKARYGILLHDTKAQVAEHEAHLAAQAAEFEERLAAQAAEFEERLAAQAAQAEAWGPRSKQVAAALLAACADPDEASAAAEASEAARQRQAVHWMDDQCTDQQSPQVHEQGIQEDWERASTGGSLQADDSSNPPCSAGKQLSVMPLRQRQQQQQVARSGACRSPAIRASCSGRAACTPAPAGRCQARILLFVSGVLLHSRDHPVNVMAGVDNYSYVPLTLQEMVTMKCNRRNTPGKPAVDGSAKDDMKFCGEGEVVLCSSSGAFAMQHFWQLAAYVPPGLQPTAKDMARRFYKALQMACVGLEGTPLYIKMMGVTEDPLLAPLFFSRKRAVQPVDVMRVSEHQTVEEWTALAATSAYCHHFNERDTGNMRAALAAAKENYRLVLDGQPVEEVDSSDCLLVCTLVVVCDVQYARLGLPSNALYTPQMVAKGAYQLVAVERRVVLDLSCEAGTGTGKVAELCVEESWVEVPLTEQPEDLGLPMNELCEMREAGDAESATPKKLWRQFGARG